MTLLETHVGAPVGIVSLVDAFAQVRGTRGLMPVPIPPLRFSLIAREVQAVMTPLEPPIELEAKSAPSGAYYFADEGRAGEDEPLSRIPPARYTLRIDSRYYERLELDLDWPPTRASLPVQLLRPGYAYPFPDVTLPSAAITLLRGTVLLGVAGTPVEKARVEITNPPNLGPFASAETDAKGSWVLAFRHANANPVNATVTITIPGEAPFDVPNVVLAAGRDNALSSTALRGAVLTTGGNAIRDAEITVGLVPNEVVRTDRNGLWTFYLDFAQPDTQTQVTATAPTGEGESVNADVVNRTTSVVPTFRIALN